MTRTIVFYVSGHGFGHASRTIEVINAVLARREDVRVVARTSAAPRLFDRTVRDARAFALAPVETDVGVVQVDSLRLDEQETVRRASDFMHSFHDRVHEEAAVLSDLDARLVVSDIPPLGIAAAIHHGVPAIALGNFTWDWIYAAYEGSNELVSQLRDIYSRADLAYRLPMHGGFDIFPRVVDLPLIARRSTRDPRETRQRLRLPADERIVLVSFGGYGLAGLDLDAVARLRGYTILVGTTVPLGEPSPLPHDRRRGSLMPFDEDAMYEAGLRYEDVVRAVDGVVTKPGYGIIAECIANGTAMLYTSRGRFAEYEVLVREMPRYLRTRHIEHATLFSGRWGDDLDALFSQPQPPERPAVDGADVAAELLLAMI